MTTHEYGEMHAVISINKTSSGQYVKTDIAIYDVPTSVDYRRITLGICSQADNQTEPYGIRTFQRGEFSDEGPTLPEMELGIKVLRTVDRKLAKLVESAGYPATFGAVVLRTFNALGVKHIRIFVRDNPYDSARESSPAVDRYLADTIDREIKTLRESCRDTNN